MRIILFSAIFLLGSLFTKENHLTAVVYQMISNVQAELRNLPELRTEIHTQDTIESDKPDIAAKKELSPMDALDIIKEQYAANFQKVGLTEDTYYYQLEDTGYYLAYEEETEASTDYLIHLYEFVEDEPEIGIGHTVTYGWYRVDRETGRITEMLQY
ncbi:MAG TPA: hypothetical protein GXX75_26375 [Clostridiales bacterium]|nr:hypothetical protein [Clostridiales bacterium]